jgi:hypothetical protein
MDEYTITILVALFGFLAIAAILLVPVYLFLNREEELSKEWTEEALARRLRESEPVGDGAPANSSHPEKPPEPPLPSKP